MRIRGLGFLAFYSFVNAIRANLILAMMVTLSSKFLLSIEPRYLNSGTTLSVPHLDGGDRRIGQKLAQVSHWLPKVHCNGLTCRMRHHPPPNAVIVESPST
jgi:hypothetical protein